MMPHALHLASLLTAASVAGLWQGAALALMAATLLRLMPRASAGLRHTLLVVLFALAVLLPWVRLHGASTNSGLRVAPWVGGLIAGLWLAVASTRATQLFLAWRHLGNVRRNAIPIAFEGVSAFSAGPRRALLCTSPDVDSPMILGFLSPRLLLPEWMVPKLSPEDLHQIALHECEHLRRRDDWINLLLQVGLTVSPLNPALIWMNRSIGVQRELAVDAAVIARTAAPLTYASCLTRLAEERMQRSHLRLALAAWGRKSELAQRVHALLQQPALWSKRQSALAAGITGALLLTASTGIARVPQLVRIADAPIAPAAAPNVATSVPILQMPAFAHSSHPDGAAAVHMVATSFEFKPAKLKPRKTHAKRRSATMPLPAFGAVQTTMPQTNLHPRMVRTSAMAGTPAHAVKATADLTNELPVRLITAEFASPYVAVPTANGWLLIEL